MFNEYQVYKALPVFKINRAEAVLLWKARDRDYAHLCNKIKATDNGPVASNLLQKIAQELQGDTLEEYFGVNIPYDYPEAGKEVRLLWIKKILKHNDFWPRGEESEIEIPLELSKIRTLVYKHLPVFGVTAAELEVLRKVADGDNSDGREYLCYRLSWLSTRRYKVDSIERVRNKVLESLDGLGVLESYLKRCVKKKGYGRAQWQRELYRLGTGTIRDMWVQKIIAHNTGEKA